MSYYSYEAHGTDRLTEFINEGGVINEGDELIDEPDDSDEGTP